MAKASLDRACITCGGNVWYIYPEKRTKARCVACAHEYANISHAHRRLLVKKIAEYEEVLELIADSDHDREAIRQLVIETLEKFK